LRPPCRDTDGDVFTDIQDQLNSECAGLPNNRKVQDFGAPVLAFDGTTTLYDRSVDDQARLLCDPKGRDLTSQVEEEMEKLLRKSPYLLVSERPN
jgi:hypothetical protein